jgi:hypothetical protein
MNATVPQIFPPGLPLLHGPELTEHLAAWAAARIPHVGADGFGPCWAVGVVRGDAMAAVVVLHDFQPSLGTVQLSAAADSPRWATRQVVGAILGAAFLGRLGAPVRRVWTATPSTNERAVRFNLGVGFVREAVLREHYAPKVHAVICGMMAREWQRKYGG